MTFNTATESDRRTAPVDTAPPQKLNGRQKIQIAERAVRCVRSVDRYEAGLTGPNASLHIEQAMGELGLERFINHRR